MPPKKKGSGSKKKGSGSKKRKAPSKKTTPPITLWVVKLVVFFALLLCILFFWNELSTSVRQFISQRLPKKVAKQNPDPAIFLPHLVNSSLFQLNIPRESIVGSEKLPHGRGPSHVVKVCKVEIPGHMRVNAIVTQLRKSLKSTDFSVHQEQISDKGGYRSKISIMRKADTWYELFLIPKRHIEEVRRAKIAIIVDDIGYNLSALRRLLSIQRPITFSVLPGLSNTERALGIIKSSGSEAMLHIPMEPNAYPEVNPGENALLLNMSDEEISSTMLHFLRQCSIAVGANNHMGSRFTQDLSKMETVLNVLKKKNLFFIDSRTSDKSVCESAAYHVDIPFASRDVFLDDRQEKEHISAQIDKLIEKAEQKGYAIGIAHPYATTISVFEKRLPLLDSNRISLVKVSTLIKEIH